LQAPVAAFVLAGLASQTGPLAGLIAPVFAYVLFPYILTMSGGGIASTVGRGISRVGFSGAAGVAKSVGSGYLGGSLGSPGSGLGINSGTGTNGGTAGSRVRITPSWASKAQASRIDAEAPSSPTPETGSETLSIIGISGPKLTLKERIKLGYYNFRERMELRKIGLMEKVNRMIPQEVKTFLGHVRDGIETGAMAWSLHTGKTTQKRVKRNTIDEIRTKRGELYWNVLNRHLKEEQNNSSLPSNTAEDPELERRAFLERGREKLDSIRRTMSGTPGEDQNRGDRF
jgi:hypothetical protein